MCQLLEYEFVMCACFVCREEGVVLKDLDSKWEPSDRGTKWLKLKPDYIQAESDLDVLIIGKNLVHESLCYGAVVKIFEVRKEDYFVMLCLEFLNVLSMNVFVCIPRFYQS